VRRLGAILFLNCRNDNIACPLTDDSLSNQARKALVYAHTQIHHPSCWKFNKARQNWLIRNIWSLECVPEKYLPLTMRYLKNVQGGSRETLIRACNVVISAVQEQNSTQTPHKEVSLTEDVNESADQFHDSQKARAQRLLHVLSSPGSDS